MFLFEVASTLRSTIWAQIDVLVSRRHNTCINLVCTLNTFFEKNLARTKLSLVRASTILSSARRPAGLPYITKKIIPGRTEAPQKGLRPLNKSIRGGKSDSFGYVFVRILFGKLFWKMRSKFDHIKITQKIWILLAESFSTVVSELSYTALLVCPGIDFLCVSTGPIQLYIGIT